MSGLWRPEFEAQWDQWVEKARESPPEALEHFEDFYHRIDEEDRAVVEHALSDWLYEDDSARRSAAETLIETLAIRSALPIIRSRHAEQTGISKKQLRIIAELEALRPLDSDPPQDPTAVGLTRENFEYYWDLRVADAEESRDGNRAWLQLLDYYEVIGQNDRRVVDGAMTDWLMGDDRHRQFAAEAVVSRFEVRTALPALRVALARTSDYREKFQRILSRLEGGAS